MKFQHSALVQSLASHSHSHSHFDPTSLRRGAPLPIAREHDELVASPKSAFSTLKSSRRQSSHSEFSVFYDAEEFDGAEEFVLEDPPEESQGSQLSDPPSTMQPSASTSSGFSSSATSDDDSDSDDVLTAYAETAPSTTVTSLHERAIVRRTQLPSPVVGDEGSLFAVLKKNVGKVSTLSLVRF